jgi:ABC-type Fe3+/spermidine/putrescine transport system ATPase subunit
VVRPVQVGGAHRLEVPTGLAQFSAGADAMVMVRPERIRLSAAAPAGTANAIPVTLVEMIFQGPVVRFMLRDERGTGLVAHVDEDERPNGIARGAKVWASWDRTASRLLPPRAPSAQAAETDELGKL